MARRRLNPASSESKILKVEIMETGFSSDTQVLMEGGKTKQIEYVAVGDKVLSRCEFTGELAYKRVVKTFEHSYCDATDTLQRDGIAVCNVTYTTTNSEWQGRYVGSGNETEGVLRVSPEQEICMIDFFRTTADKIQRGDKLFAGEQMQVIAVGVDNDQDTISIHWKRGWSVLSVTPEHPIWVQGKGWTAVRDIRPDDRFLTSDGSEAVAQKVTRGCSQ